MLDQRQALDVHALQMVRPDHASLLSAALCNTAWWQRCVFMLMLLVSASDRRPDSHGTQVFCSLLIQEEPARRFGWETCGRNKSSAKLHTDVS